MGMPVKRVGVTLLAAIVALSGCAAANSLEGPTSATATRTAAKARPKTVLVGKTVKGPDYSFTLPTGWQLGSVGGVEYESMVYRSPDGQLAALVGVDFEGGVARAPSQKQIDRIKRDYVGRAIQEGGRDVFAYDGPGIDGAPSLRLIGKVGEGSEPMSVESYIVWANGNAYSITFGFMKGHTAKARHGVVAAVLKSWKWR